MSLAPNNSKPPITAIAAGPKTARQIDDIATKKADRRFYATAVLALGAAATIAIFLPGGKQETPAPRTVDEVPQAMVDHMQANMDSGVLNSNTVTVPMVTKDQYSVVPSVTPYEIVAKMNEGVLTNGHLSTTDFLTAQSLVKGQMDHKVDVQPDVPGEQIAAPKFSDGGSG